MKAKSLHLVKSTFNMFIKRTYYTVNFYYVECRYFEFFIISNYIEISLKLPLHCVLHSITRNKINRIFKFN